MLVRVEGGAFAGPALSSALDRSALSGADRSLATDLVYGTLRHLLLLRACLAPHLRAPERLPNEIAAVLELGSYELLIRQTPQHAAVHSWVEVAKMRHRRLAGLVNAVLRRVTMRDDLDPATRHSLPDWLYQELRRGLGDATDAALTAMRQPGPLWLACTATPPRDCQQATEQLLADGCEVEAGPVAHTLRVRSPRPLHRLTAFRRGLVQPQNPSSALVCDLLEPNPGERVLDLCSGNGIKAARLAAAGAAVTAVEIDATKIARAQRNLARLGVEVQHQQADLRTVPDLEPAPKVLLDAPCSGTGTLRAHPEIALRLEPQALDGLVTLQQQLLDTAAALTAPGGILLYAVCSLSAAEGNEQIGRFLERHPDFAPVPTPLQLPHQQARHGSYLLPFDGVDGFFVARLERQPTTPGGRRSVP